MAHVREGRQTFDEEVFKSAEYRNMVLADVPDDEKSALEDSDIESVEDSDDDYGGAEESEESEDSDSADTDDETSERIPTEPVVRDDTVSVEKRLPKKRLQKGLAGETRRRSAPWSCGRAHLAHDAHERHDRERCVQLASSERHSRRTIGYGASAQRPPDRAIPASRAIRCCARTAVQARHPLRRAASCNRVAAA